MRGSFLLKGQVSEGRMVTFIKIPFYSLFIIFYFIFIDKHRYIKGQEGHKAHRDSLFIISSFRIKELRKLFKIFLWRAIMEGSERQVALWAEGAFHIRELLQHKHRHTHTDTERERHTHTGGASIHTRTQRRSLNTHTHTGRGGGGGGDTHTHRRRRGRHTHAHTGRGGASKGGGGGGKRWGASIQLYLSI